MEVKAGRNISSSNSNSSNSSSTIQSDEDLDLRRGPWTVEEDFKLINYIANHGEGRWNSLARCAGLKRTGKSCRLRWLNYLRPDVRRGNITLEEQLLILELHSRWGNRWSKIAQHLPGRTDNEIKNYWRTRVQKHAKQLKCDVNSKQFKDTMRYLWMPRLIERIQAANANNNNNNTATATVAIATGASPGGLSTITTAMPTANATSNIAQNTSCFVNAVNDHHVGTAGHMIMPINNGTIGTGTITATANDRFSGSQITTSYTPENSSTGASSDSFGTVSDLTDYYNISVHNNNPNPDYNNFQAAAAAAAASGCQVGGFAESSLISPTGYYNPGIYFQAAMEANNDQLIDDGDASDNLWNVDDMWFLQQQFNSNM